MTGVVRSEEYEGPALAWLFEQVERLRSALQENGVTEEATQREICETFFFGLCVDLDDEMTHDERPRRHLALETADVLLLPDGDSFSFHEYAMGVVGEAFGDD